MYKKISIVLFLIIVALLAYYNLYTTEAKIGVIDMQKLLDESSRAEELQENLEAKSQELQQKYENLDEENTDLEDRKNQIQMEYEQNKQEIERQLNNEIDQVINELNQNDQYSVILYKNKVYYGGEDITDKVVEILDEKFSEVDADEQ